MRTKADEERRGLETQIAELRKTLDEKQTQENLLHSAKRRAEREATDSKQKLLSVEREMERVRNRLDRPASVLSGSPNSSPRK
ncbi:hypothetical protein K435DRAFT_660593 [Dendrothele bispora CBS 962.96]|uniref:Uncharacterized protein n=1 Tax=Dendrothele bispora (strain CBS 962.96) TaxID=1314807 RepID=A0A4S8M8D6_DENBC|nr:hypothetical protein K435DRAFT_660593 [Dendrothele bispora CBS 962.96]